MIYCRKDRVLTDIVITVLLLCGLLFFSGIPASAQDQEIPVMAPLNPKFVDYMNVKSVPRLSIPNVTSDGYGLGYIPSPLDLSHLAGQSIFPADSLRATSMEAPLQALPASYDLRTSGKVTEVRNQLSCGDCWAFATMGSTESDLLMSAGETWDFSEYNLNMNHGFDWLPCEGGNGDMSTAYLARWGDQDYQSGPINENDDPYPASFNPPPAYTPPVSPTLQKHLQEVIIVPPRTGYSDNDNLKNAVMTYGGVMTSYYASSSYATKSCPPPTGTCTTYNYSGSSTANHAVTIVGWDDNFPSGSFTPAATHNGAFIIKNSWGTGWGVNGGYFYISYDDSQLARDYSYVFNGAQPTNNYTRIYQYDPLGWTSGLGYGSTTGWFANIFTAAANEQLTAVSFYVASPGSPYEIYVYSNVVAGAPRSGSLGSANTGTMATPGYHTVTLTSPVSVTAGQSFSVVVKLTTPGYNYPIPMEQPWNGYSAGATASAGQSFISSSGTSWSDITLSYDSNTNVCIKAFTGSATQYELTLSASGGGVITPDCSGGCWYNAGASVGVLASPNNGYVMDSWTGDCSASGSNSSTAVIMDGVKSCTANFASCGNLPAKDASNATTYASIGDITTGAYVAASDPDIIRLLATTLPEALNLNRPISITLSGGWNCGFVTQASYSIIQGSLTIGNNSLTVTAENLIIY